MFILGVYGAVMLEINTHKFIEEILSCGIQIQKFRTKIWKEGSLVLVI